MPVSMYVIVVAGPHRNRKQLKAVMVGRYLNGNKDERISSTYSMLARKKIQFAQVTKFISSNYGLRTFHPSSSSSCTFRTKTARRLTRIIHTSGTFLGSSNALLYSFPNAYSFSPLRWTTSTHFCRLTIIDTIYDTCG